MAAEVVDGAGAATGTLLIDSAIARTGVLARSSAFCRFLARARRSRARAPGGGAFWFD